MASKHIIPMSDDAAGLTPRDVQITVLPDDFLRSTLASATAGFHMPLFSEIPVIDLYRDQVVSYISEVCSPLSSYTEGPILTPAMVNNYVKAGIVPAPVKKRYGREHVARLLLVCTFKQVLPLSAIQRLIRSQSLTTGFEHSYNHIALELNCAIQQAFSLTQSETYADAGKMTSEQLLVKAASSAFAARAFLMAYLSYYGCRS